MGRRLIMVKSQRAKWIVVKVAAFKAGELF